jgi:hypothetical protein
MIPSGKWSCLSKPLKFLGYPKPLPATRYGAIYDVKLGGEELSQSEGRIDTRYYIVYQDGTLINIRGAVDSNTWSDATTLFTEATPIADISLSFDSLGRPVVFYEKSTGGVFLWFYDSQLGTTTVRTIDPIGITPVVNYDIITDTSNVAGDIMLYYVRNDVIYTRLQRDRYDIEYQTGVSYPNLRLDKSGMTEDNRFQVTYTFDDLRDGSLLHRKVLESDTFVFRQMQSNNFTLGFTIALAPSDCELRKLTNDYGIGANGRFCVVDHSGNHQNTIHPYEERLFTLEFLFFDDTDDSDIVIIVHRTGFDEGYYLTQQVSNFRFTNGNYILRFTQAAPVGETPMKRIELIKDSVTIIDQVVADLPSPFGQTPSSDRNRLRFGACTEYNTDTVTQYKNLFPAVFTNIYTIANSTRTDWFKAFSDQYIQSTPSGNPLTLRKNGDNTYIFSGGSSAT